MRNNNVVPLNPEFTFNAYQKAVLAFRKPTADIIYAIMGLCEEAGEVAGKVAKARRDQTWSPEVLEKLKQDIKKELGDVLWMVAAVADDFGLTLQEIAQGNYSKLADRDARGVISGSGDDR